MAVVHLLRSKSMPFGRKAGGFGAGGAAVGAGGTGDIWTVLIPKKAESYSFEKIIGLYKPLMPFIRDHMEVL